MVSPVSGVRNAAVGLAREGARIEKAAADINKAFVAAQNAQAADSVSVSGAASAAPAVEDAVRGAVLSTHGDLSTALVNVLQARAAYGANIVSAKVTGDVESDLARLLARREV